jgi:hypothetical protein
MRSPTVPQCIHPNCNLQSLLANLHEPDPKESMKASISIFDIEVENFDIRL